MRIIFTTVLSLIISSSVFGQETKKKTVESEIPHTKEVFYVLTNNPDIKHGKYKRTYLGAIKLTEQGQYENNVKVGVWEYYGLKGELEQKIDFTNNTVIYAKAFTILTRSLILDGETLKENNSGEKPVLLGGQSKFIHYLVKYTRYPEAAKRIGEQGDILISATVTKDGLLIDEKVEEGIGFGLDEEALRVVQLLPDEWIPLKINGEVLNSRVFIIVRFRLG